MQIESTEPGTTQRRRNGILLAITVVVLAVVLFFVLPRAFNLGRSSIDTPAAAARTQ